MDHINLDRLADLEFVLEYRSRMASHEDRYLARKVNFWRDIFPEPVLTALTGKTAGDSITFEPDPQNPVFFYDGPSELRIRTSQFDAPIENGSRAKPRYGRFYPKGRLSGIAGVFPQNVQPFRCVDVNNGHMGVNFQHPLYGKSVALTAHIRRIQPKSSELGGSSIDWMEAISSGAGMQMRFNGRPTDFRSPSGWQRQDRSEDVLFYREPRFVKHMDDMALTTVSSLYQRLLPADGDVLDLMSSWVSHLPEDLKFRSVTGLGLNRVELSANERLDRYEVLDLNQHPQMPFDDTSFDAVICTSSVEYLTRPVDVMNDIARVLRPNGTVVFTFTNRWFPPKVIQLWPHLHEFERMGLVLEYLDETGKFDRFNTLSVRGYPRPITDKYYPNQLISDPVFAVWARRISTINHERS